eukprot:SAG25_NODE_947_length_4626_cov_2.304838_1_plen_44_part_10
MSNALPLATPCGRYPRRWGFDLKGSTRGRRAASGSPPPPPPPPP